MSDAPLIRQLFQHLGIASPTTLDERLDVLRKKGEGQLADGLQALLRNAEKRDEALKLHTHNLLLKCSEFSKANTQLKAEAAHQKVALTLLQNTLQRLTQSSEGEGGSIDLHGHAFDDDLIRLTSELEALVHQREAARQALAVSESRNRNILDSLHEVVFQTNTRGHWTYLNRAWGLITGFSVDECMGQRALSYIHPEDRKRHINLLLSLINREETSFRLQLRFVTRDFGYRWLEVFTKRIEDGQGKLTGISGSLIDITEQKLAQDKMMISEERLNQALIATNSRLWDWDMSKPQPYVDPKWLVTLGYDVDDPSLKDLQWNLQIHPEDLPRWTEHLQEHLHRKRAELDIELRFATRQGDWRHASLRGKVILWRGRRALRMAGMLLDITARKEAEEAALRQQELTEQILDQLPIAVFLKNRNGQFVRFNRQFKLFAKRSREEMLNKQDSSFSVLPWPDTSQQDDELAWKTGQLVTTERRLTNVNPPLDVLMNRIVIDIGRGESYLLGFSIDISEQRAAREAMQRAVESAEAASRAKSEFLANMSHEIRTPMNGILGMTELALDTPLSRDQREYLSLVKSSADALLIIINDILDFSKIEAGKFDIDEVLFDLRKLIIDTAKSMSLRAHQKSLELVCDVPASLPRFMKGDPGRLRQVLVNLLGNAIKFTHHGEIVLGVRVFSEEGEYSTLEFSVRDTGIGIPPEKQMHIFEAFSQVDGSTTRLYGGTGLGLTICKRLVALMHGQMDLISTPGLGSLFKFTVRLRQAGSVLQAPFPSDVLKGKTALVVDDNATNRRVLVGILGQAGLHVSQCSSGREALTLLSVQAKPSLLILDGNMPEMDGFATAALVLQQPNPPALLLLISADQQADKERARHLGLDHYLVKPVSGPELIGSIQTLLGQRPSSSTLLPLTPFARDTPKGALHILLAEDNLINQQLVLRLFEKLGHRLTLVDNGAAAVALATKESFDLIFMDVQMPEMDGLIATAHIRQWEQQHGGHTPIVAMTARAMQGDRERCIAAGMDDYLSKPIHTQRVHQLLAQYCRTDPQPLKHEILQWNKALIRLDGDAELLLELAEIFLKDGPTLTQQLEDALARSDDPAVRRDLHSLKGVLVNFGAYHAAQQAELLEEAMEQDAERAAEAALMVRLNNALQDVYSALQELIAAGPAVS